MSIIQRRELDDIIIYKNAALLNLALTVHILSKSLYGTEEYKNDSNDYLAYLVKNGDVYEDLRLVWL